MVYYCTIKTCKSSSYKSKKEEKKLVNFYNFPKCVEMRKKWILACKKNANEKTPYICELHFQKTDFELHWLEEKEKLPGGLKSRKRLKKTAVPSLYLDSNSSCNETPSITQTIRERKKIVDELIQKNLSETFSDHEEQNVNATSQNVEYIICTPTLPSVIDKLNQRDYSTQTEFEVQLSSAESRIRNLEKNCKSLKRLVNQHKKKNLQLKAKFSQLKNSLAKFLTKTQISKLQRNRQVERKQILQCRS